MSDSKKKTDKIFYIYYEINKNLFAVYDPWHKKYSEKTLAELNQLSNKYEMMAGFEADKYGLIEYYLSFMKWNNELKENGLIQYTYSYKNKYAVLNAFERYTGLKLKTLKTDNIIDGIESKYFALIINPTQTSNGIPNWNKIYVDFGDLPSKHPQATSFKFFVEMLPSETGKACELYLDNLKWIQW
jgi:hypothetical protein